MYETSSPAVASRITQVQDKMDTLFSFVSKLETISIELSKRLDGVVSQVDNPNNTKATSIAPVPTKTLVPLASRLDDINHRIEDVCMRLGYNLDHLEL